MGRKIGKLDYRAIGLPPKVWAALEREGEREAPTLPIRDNPGNWLLKSFAWAWYKSQTHTPRHNYLTTDQAEKLIEEAQKED